MSRTISPIFIRRAGGQYELTGASIIVKQDGNRFVVEVDNEQSLMDAIAANRMDTVKVLLDSGRG